MVGLGVAAQSPVPEQAQSLSVRQQLDCAEIWQIEFARTLRKQLAVDRGGGAHLAVGLGDVNCLGGNSTVVAVVLRIGRDGLAIRHPELVDFANQLAVIIEALHNSSFEK